VRINKENVSLFITNQGLIVGEVETTETFDVPGQIRLKYPMLVVQADKGIYLTNLFMKEEWAILSTSNIAEINVAEAIVEGYCDKVQEVHGSIITLDKKVII
jgi:hypothetical protein